jgi:hypothetical protein
LQNWGCLWRVGTRARQVFTAVVLDDPARLLAEYRTRPAT